MAPTVSFDGRIGIDAMLIVKVNVLQTKPLEAGFACPFHILGPSVHAQELPLGPTDISEFGCENHLVAAAANGAPHQLFVFSDAVHIRGVRSEEHTSELQSPMYL